MNKKSGREHQRHSTCQGNGWMALRSPSLSGLVEEDPAELPVVARLQRPLLQQEEQRQRYLGEDGRAPAVHEDLRCQREQQHMKLIILKITLFDATVITR